jgi:hypothetical protein
MEHQAVVNSATEVAEDPLQSSEMWLSGIMHMKAVLLNCTSDVRPCELKVLQSTSKAPIGSRISNWGALSC